MRTVAFIGLGVMGAPLAGHLAKAGYALRVYNRSPEKSQHWLSKHKAYQSVIADTPHAAIENADYIITCVGNDDDLEGLIVGAGGIASGIKSGAIVIDHTTTSANLAVKLNRQLADLNVGFLDAPVSGGQSGAEQGQLTIMVGGDHDIYKKAEALLQVYSKRVRHLGEAGKGQQCKMVNQICAAGLIQALAEGLHFAKAVDLDLSSVIDVISQGAAQSWQMDNRAHTMIAGDYDFGFAVDWMCKDLNIVMQQANAANVELPVTEMVSQFYGQLHDMGCGRWDTSALLARMEAAKSD